MSFQQKNHTDSRPGLLSSLAADQWHLIRERVLRSSLQECLAESMSSAKLLAAQSKDQFNQLAEKIAGQFSEGTLDEFALRPIDLKDSLSVVMPVYNEERLVRQAVLELANIPVVDQIIIVNDGSTDSTDDICRDLKKNFENDKAEGLNGKQLPSGLLYHSLEKNRGKGFAIRKGFQIANCRWVAIQDADREYDPKDFIRLHQLATSSNATVVYGDRFANVIRLDQGNSATFLPDESLLKTTNPFLAESCTESDSVSPAWHQNANHFLSRIASFRCGQTIRDIETCQKLFATKLIQSVVGDLSEDRFGIEIEMTIKLSRLADFRFRQAPISYFRRSYEEGKKIGWKDGIRALYCLLAY